MISPDFLADLLQRVDIVDVVGDYVPLKKSGQNYMACCPFHKEKTPSFSVAPTKQFYHCFSCGAHGNALDFIKEYLNLGFVEAVEKLADRVGMTVRHETVNPLAAAAAREKKQRQQTLSEMTAQCLRFYQDALKNSARAQSYLAKRGLDTAVIAQFALGYAPGDYQALKSLFPVYPQPQLVEAGMVIVKDDRAYDRFRDRVMFPIRNVHGEVVGFGARVIDQGEPKYLNSPETPLFDKGRELYGLYEGREAIRHAGRVVVVEGYMDVVALAQNGIGYAVASLGTSTTADQINLLMRHSEEVYFCYDGDAAGRKAAWRALENALPILKESHRLNFVFLPAEHDPDTYVREFGASGFETLLNRQGLTLTQYFWKELQQRHDTATQEGKAALMRQAHALIDTVRVPTLHYMMLQNLAEIVGIELYDLQQLFGKAPPRERPKEHYRRLRLPETSRRPRPSSTLLEKQIRALLINPQWAAHCKIPDFLHIDGDLAILAAIAERINACDRVPTYGVLLALLDESEYAARIDDIMQTTSAGTLDEADAASEQVFCDGMGKILQEVRWNQIAHLQAQQQQRELSAQEWAMLKHLLAGGLIPSKGDGYA